MRALCAANKGVLCSRMMAINCCAPNSGIAGALADLRFTVLALAVCGGAAACAAAHTESENNRPLAKGKAEENRRTGLILIFGFVKGMS